MGGDGVRPFDELPVIEQLGLRQAWDEHGPGDQLGTVNFMTPATILAATAAVRDGATCRLDLPLDQPSPPLFGRAPLGHEVFPRSRNTWDDRITNLDPQGSTQWDGLRHVQCRELGHYGGRTGDPRDHDDLGIEHWARTGIVGRGVLVDIPRHRAGAGRPWDPLAPTAISAAEVADALGAQAVEHRPGDVLCVRTGWVAAYLDAREDDHRRVAAERTFAGLAADEAMARFLWDGRFVAVTADNPAVEVSPGDPAVGSLHRRLVPLLGFALGELFTFEELAARCEARSDWTFLFVAAPLHLPGGVGSPGNALAIL